MTHTLNNPCATAHGQPGNKERESNSPRERHQFKWMGRGDIHIQDGCSDSTRTSDQGDCQRENANIFACPGLLSLRFGLTCTGWAAKEHIHGHQEEQSATGHVKSIELDPQTSQQKTSNQSEKDDNACADDCSTRYNGLPLLFGEVGAKPNEDR